MDDAAWLDSPAMLPLVRRLASAVARRYRLDEGTAGRLVSEALSHDHGLRRLVGQGLDASAIERTRAFQAAATVARRHVYHQLRRYRRAEPDGTLVGRLDGWAAAPPAERQALLRQLAAGHVSTLERLDSVDDFHRQLFALVGSPRSVLDVGCGLYPLLFPFDGAGSGVAAYAAVDKHPGWVEAVAAYAQARGDGRLLPVRLDLAGGWEPLPRPAGLARFDVALLLKLVPVLQRQQRATLEVIRRTPARMLVLTGSVTSMTRRERVDRRERAVLRRLVGSAGWPVVGELDTEEEFGLAVLTGEA
jgi:16S rRNA (guanine(1405)-N(7))-methyltransferase